jgi:hypothetical protein
MLVAAIAAVQAQVLQTVPATRTLVAAVLRLQLLQLLALICRPALLLRQRSVCVS